MNIVRWIPNSDNSSRSSPQFCCGVTLLPFKQKLVILQVTCSSRRRQYPSPNNSGSNELHWSGMSLLLASLFSIATLLASLVSAAGHSLLTYSSVLYLARYDNYCREVLPILSVASMSHSETVSMSTMMYRDITLFTWPLPLALVLHNCWPLSRPPGVRSPTRASVHRAVPVPC